MTKMQWALVALALVCVVLVLMPSERWEAIGELKQRLSDSDSMACLDYERELLKDPGSARLVSFTRSEADKTDVQITYRAKNSYGAYVSTTATCSVINGKVSLEGTRLVRSTAEIQKSIDKLAQENECLSKRRELLKSGLTFVEATEQTELIIKRCKDFPPK